MAIRLEITCIIKGDRDNPHERIQTIGGDGFRYSLPEAIRLIENGTCTFWTLRRRKNCKRDRRDPQWQ